MSFQSCYGFPPCHRDCSAGHCEWQRAFEWAARNGQGPQFWEGRKSCKMWVELCFCWVCTGKFVNYFFWGGSFIHYLQRCMTRPKDKNWSRWIFSTNLCFLQNEMMGMYIDTVIRSKPTMFTWAIPDMNPGSTKSLTKEPHQLVAEGTKRYKVWWNRQWFLKFLVAIGLGYLEFVYGITWKTYNIVNGLECRTIEWDCFAFWDCCQRS